MKKEGPWWWLLAILAVISDIYILSVFGHIIIRLVSFGAATTIDERKSSIENLFSVSRDSNRYVLGLGISALVGIGTLIVIGSIIISSVEM